LMGFGFVVARFGLFLQQLQLIQHDSSAPTYGLSLWFGTALIAGGVIVNVFAGWRYARLVRELDRGEKTHSYPLTKALAIAVFLALVGLAMTIYLVWIRPATRSQLKSSEEISMTTSATTGIINKPSNHSVDETVEKLKGLLSAKEIALFALIDHSGEAEKVGL